MTELDCIDCSGWSNNVCDVANRGAAGSAEVEDFRTWPNVDVIKPTEDTRSKLTAERVPDTVFGFGIGERVRVAIETRSRWGVDRYAFLAVNRLARREVLGYKEIFLATASNEDTGMTMGFLKEPALSAIALKHQSLSCPTTKDASIVPKYFWEAAVGKVVR